MEGLYPNLSRMHWHTINIIFHHTAIVESEQWCILGENLWSHIAVGTEGLTTLTSWNNILTLTKYSCTGERQLQTDLFVFIPYCIFLF